MSDKELISDRDKLTDTGQGILFSVNMNNINSSEFNNKGYLIVNDFLSGKQCDEILNLIANYQEKYKVTEVYRPYAERDLRYSVINGQQIEEHLPKIWQLYENVNSLVNEISGQDLVELSSKLPAVNVNIIKLGGEYRWHYDRNAVTALLYLNTFDGGELEMYPNYRLGSRSKKFTLLQKFFDSFLKVKLIRYFSGKKVSIKPQKNMLVIMRGDRCLHSVKGLEGNQERINIVMAYDLPGMKFPVESGLNSYLYTNKSAISSDANYL